MARNEKRTNEVKTYLTETEFAELCNGMDDDLPLSIWVRRVLLSAARAKQDYSLVDAIDNTKTIEVTL